MIRSIRTLLCLAAATAAFAFGLALPASAQVDIAPGLAGIYTMDAQQMLAQKGFLKGQATGSYDNRTRDAIRSYQRAAGIPVTGVLDQRLVEQLRFGPPVAAQHAPSGATRAKAKPRTAPAADGYIRLAQEELARLGLYRGTVDGRGGSKTTEAVLRYQAKNDLPMTGKVDAALIKHLLGGQPVGSVAAPAPAAPQAQPAVAPPQAAPAQAAPAPAAKDEAPAAGAPPAATETVPVPKFPAKQPAGAAQTPTPAPATPAEPLFQRS